MPGAWTRTATAMVLALALALSACQGAASMPEAISTAQAVSALGTSLPTDAANVRAAQEQGMDRLILLRFDAAEDEVGTFARALAKADPVAGQDPGLFYLGKSLDWWVSDMPAGSAGMQGTSATGLAVKLLAVPLGSGRARVYVAAFSS